jgi:hypothetical protein
MDRRALLAARRAGSTPHGFALRHGSASKVTLDGAVLEGEIRGLRRRPSAGVVLYFSLATLGTSMATSCSCTGRHGSWCWKVRKTLQQRGHDVSRRRSGWASVALVVSGELETHVADVGT